MQPLPDKINPAFKTGTRTDFRETQEELEKQKNIGISLGISQGEQQGKTQINELHRLLIEADRLDDLKRSTTDSEYQQQLLKEFGL